MYIHIYIYIYILFLTVYVGPLKDYSHTYIIDYIYIYIILFRSMSSEVNIRSFLWGKFKSYFFQDNLYSLIYTYIWKHIIGCVEELCIHTYIFFLRPITEPSRYIYLSNRIPSEPDIKSFFIKKPWIPFFQDKLHIIQTYMYCII